MKLEEAIKQLESLQKDRKSFIEDETESNSIFMEDYEAIETVLMALKDYKKENEELKNMDLTTVYLKGVADEKERWRNKVKKL